MQPRAVLSRISAAKSRKDTPEDVARRSQDQVTSSFAKVYELYENRLRSSNALDFDDLLLEAVRLLNHDPATRAKLNQRYEFVMVDEYQDTNRSQYELMRLLTEERGNVAVVGDEDQSIYGWRGANIRNILDFERDFQGAKIIRLEQNYRSTKNILEAASAVVANNTERIGKWLWTESGPGERIKIYTAPDAENEALWIADTIESHLSRQPGDHVAVLYRTNSQSRQIEEALRRYGRKYVVVGGFSFYQRAEVKDILAYLKVLASPADSISLLRIINTPARGIGRTTVEQIEQYALKNGLPLWHALRRMLDEQAFPARAEAALAGFRRMMENIAGGADSRPLAETLRRVLLDTGYRQMLEQEGTQEALARLANLEELLNAAADADQRGERLRDFLDHAALVSDADQVDERAPVSLLTMHNAKGLEFPIVFIAGMEEGLFPHSRSISDSESAMEEERRLCYVAMTRARKRLYLSWAKYRRRFGGGMPEASVRSRFLQEIPVNQVERVGDAVSHPRALDLTAERHVVRETAQRNLYTGKTLNSVESIQQYFAARAKAAGAPGMSVQGAPAPAARAAPPAAAKPAAPRPGKKVGPGSVIQHEKFGRGSIVRIEGSGEDAKITVNFERGGLKKMVAKYAGIRID